MTIVDVFSTITIHLIVDYIAVNFKLHNHLSQLTIDSKKKKMTTSDMAIYMIYIVMEYMYKSIQGQNFLVSTWS